jgi:glutathione S-transferase
LSTPRYTLIYFDARGRAEPIRLVLVHAGVAFNDRALSRDQWMALKPESPLGQMPILVEHTSQGDVVTPQSAAILRHLARVHDLYGQDEHERLKADVATDTAMDLRNAFSSLRFSAAWADPAAREKYVTGTAPAHLARLSKLLGQRDWYASDRPTFADLVVYDTIDGHVAAWPDCVAAYPNLGAFCRRVRELPSMQAYFGSQRPA